MGSLPGTAHHAALALAASASLLSCKRNEPVPCEPATVVIESGPGLRKPGPHEASDWTIHHGDILHPGSPEDSIAWSGKVDDVSTRRNGPLIAAKRTPAEDTFYVFQSDLRPTVQVARADFLCDRLGNPTSFSQPCDKSLLRRLLPNGDTIGFAVCENTECPLILAGINGVSTTRIEGLADVRVARFSGWDVLLATSQWGREEGHTGQDLVVLLASNGQMRRLAKLRIVEADSRVDGVLRWQIASWSVTPAGIRISGERAVVNRASGDRRETIAVDEMWFITAAGTAVGDKSER